MTKLFVLLISDDEEVPGSNPAGGGIQLMTLQHYFAQSFIITPSSTQYDLVEREVKYQPIINIYCQSVKMQENINFIFLCHSLC